MKCNIKREWLKQALNHCRYGKYFSDGIFLLQDSVCCQSKANGRCCLDQEEDLFDREEKVIF